MESANLENDVFEYQNEQDRAKFNNLHYLFNDGGQDLFREQLEDYLKLSDEDLANAFPIDKKGQKEGKLKTRITSMIDEIDIMEEKFEKANDLFPDTSNKSIYKKGSREYEIEKLKEESIKHAKMLYMFTDDSFDKAVDRYTKLFEKLEIEPLFKGMDANDITVLTDSANITEEILFLASEIELLKDSESAKDKKLAKQKVKKIEKLNAFKTVITDPENLTKTGQFDKRKKSKLDKVFNDYIRFIADSNDAFIKSDIIENALEDIIDYNSLKDNAKLYSKSLEAFLIPENYNKLLDATYNFNKSKFENREKTFKKQIEEYIGIQERNTLLNQLNSLNVIPDPEEVEAFLLTGDVGKLRTFYDENGEITTNNKEKLKDINEKLEVYNATRPDKVEEEVQEKEVEIENKDLQDVVDSMEVQVQVPRTITPLLSNSLKLAYEEYSSRATLLNKKPLKYNEWLNSKAGKNYKEAFFAVKQLWVGNDLLINADNPLTGEQIKADTGLVDWLRSEEGRNDPGVLEVLNSVNLTIDELIGQKELLPEEGSIVKGDINKGVVKKESNLAIIENKSFDTKGEKVLTYKIKDKFGKDILPEILTSLNIPENALFETLDEAIKAFTKIKAAFPDTTKYIFDDIELKVGNFVYDRNGNEFIVLTSPKDIKAKGTILEIIPSDKNSDPNRLDFIKELKPGEFGNFYTLQKLEIVD